MPKTKPPLLFLHGFRGDSSGLAQIIKLLPDYKCFAPDLPPTNHQTLKHYDADNYADWIANYITKQKLEKPILIGHSMGSILAAATAAKYPHLVNQKIILLSPISTRPPRFFATLTPLLVLLPAKLVDYIVTSYLFVPKNRSLFQQTLKQTRFGSAKYHSVKALASAANFSAHHCITDFNFRQKTYLIAGSKDRICSQKQTEKIAQTHQAQTSFIPKSGHLINYEKPELVAKIIKEYLSQN